ncbi:MAG: hypothetical protein HYV39_04310 [Candidatus Levybacteria bacterium]|nr:hypothetical protein [Candidatus Levybacteria bacterium]
MSNTEIATILRNVAAAYAIKNESKYRFQIIAYQKAADAIENSTSEVKDLYKEEKLESLPGVGPSIRQHLEELITTGKVKHFAWVMQDIPESVFTLLNVPTFGPKKSYRLVSEFGLKNPIAVIADLEKIARAGKIASLEGFGAKSESDILQAIQEYKQGRAKTKRMVLPYAAELAEKVLLYLKKSKAVIQAQPLGSLRRMVSTVGDIDFAVVSNSPNEAIKHFIAYPYKDRVIEQGPTTASILISGGKQIDLMVQSKDSFGSLLQHFTGSKHHNVHLREYALKKGLSLSEHGIKKRVAGGKLRMETYETEEKFYKALGLQWIPPEMREDKGEIELASKNNLPQLVELKDIKGDFHIHSNYPIEPSHDMGKNTMEEMLEKAEKLRYEYLGFSEHNPSLSKHTSTQIYSILSRRKDKIEQLNDSNKYVRVINLLEVDILTSGKLAIDEKSLATIDAAIVSIHSNFSMDKKTMTKRVLQGLSHPKAKILAHPTGRLLNIRSGYELDFEKIFDFCIKNKKALEINAWPTRLDLPDSLVFEAIKQGVKFVIDTDSHALWQMEMMKYGVAVARRGWAKKSDILNTLPYNELISWLKS